MLLFLLLLPLQFIRRSPIFDRLFLPNDALRVSNVYDAVPASLNVGKVIDIRTHGLADKEAVSHSHAHPHPHTQRETHTHTRVQQQTRITTDLCAHVLLGHGICRRPCTVAQLLVVYCGLLCFLPGWLVGCSFASIAAVPDCAASGLAGALARLRFGAAPCHNVVRHTGLTVQSTSA